MYLMLMFATKTNIINWYMNCFLLHNDTGSAKVPVADCSQVEFSTHSKSEMRFSDYGAYWKTLINAERTRQSLGTGTSCREERGQCNELLYLKDWHFVR